MNVPSHQMKPEMERYEWVVIRHPELASSIKTQDQEDTASSEGQNSDNHSLQQPEKPAGDLSPFLSARHFNLNSKNTSMFMAGNFDSIIVGKWRLTCWLWSSCVCLCTKRNKLWDGFRTNCMLLCLSRGRGRQRPLHRLRAQPWPHWQVHHLWQPAPVCRDLSGFTAGGVGLPGRHVFIMPCTRIMHSYTHGLWYAIRTTSVLQIQTHFLIY